MQRALVVLSIFSLLLAAPLQLWADAEGPNNPNVMADDSSIGTVAWGAVNNAKVSDDARANADSNDLEDSHYLKATDFGFSVSGTIEGIELEVEQSGGKLFSGLFPRENSIKLVKGGSVCCTNKSTTAVLPSSDTYISYGGASDLWGEAWTAAQINATDFGAVFGVELRGQGGSDNSFALVDHMRITVTFTAAQSKLLITQTRRAAAFQLASVPGGRRIRPMKSIYSLNFPHLDERRL